MTIHENEEYQKGFDAGLADAIAGKEPGYKSFLRLYEQGYKDGRKNAMQSGTVITHNRLLTPDSIKPQKCAGEKSA